MSKVRIAIQFLGRLKIMSFRCVQFDSCAISRDATSALRINERELFGIDWQLSVVSGLLVEDYVDRGRTFSNSLASYHFLPRMVVRMHIHIVDSRRDILDRVFAPRKFSKESDRLNGSTCGKARVGRILCISDHSFELIFIPRGIGHGDNFLTGFVPVYVFSILELSACLPNTDHNTMTDYTIQ